MDTAEMMIVLMMTTEKHYNNTVAPFMHSNFQGARFYR